MTQIIISLISNDRTAEFLCVNFVVNFFLFLVLTFHSSVLNLCRYVAYSSTPWHYILQYTLTLHIAVHLDITYCSTPWHYILQYTLTLHIAVHLDITYCNTPWHYILQYTLTLHIAVHLYITYCSTPWHYILQYTLTLHFYLLIPVDIIHLITCS
jgi:hypothetical protein